MKPMDPSDELPQKKVDPGTAFLHSKGFLWNGQMRQLRRPVPTDQPADPNVPKPEPPARSVWVKFTPMGGAPRRYGQRYAGR